MKPLKSKDLGGFFRLELVNRAAFNEVSDR